MRFAVSARPLTAAAFLALAWLLCAFAPSHIAAQQAPETAPAAAQVTIHLFWRLGCPYCEDARAYLDARAAGDPALQVRAYEISADDRARRAFVEVAEIFQLRRVAVPTIVVGQKVFVGFGGPRETGEKLMAAADLCRTGGCLDVVERIFAEIDAPPPGRAAAEATKSVEPAGPPPTVSLPLIGEIRTETLSLPMLTVVLAAVDGFNPCAMWVLVFLIGLLLGMRDPVRMWALGAVFLLASAAVYFAFMAAWLNLVLMLGALIWVRVAVGLLALGGGAYYLREFARNPDGVCQVSDLDQRRRTMDRLRAAVAERSFLLAALGVAVLAVGVNLVELICSAGIPAIFAQVLSLSDLPVWEYYAYIALYIGVFLLDDALIFVTAMLSLQAAGATALYTRYAHLIGGAVLLILGALLLFKPEWLSFSV